MKSRTAIITAGLAALALAGTAGVGIAAADPTPAPSTSTSAAPSAAPSAKPAKEHRSLIARSLHGEVTLAGGKHRVVDFQRGTVQKVSSTSITVLSKDGFTQTYVVDSGTKVRVHKQSSTIAAVKTQDRVRVVASTKGSALTAKRIGDRGTR